MKYTDFVHEHRSSEDATTVRKWHFGFFSCVLVLLSYLFLFLVLLGDEVLSGRL